MEKEEKAKPIAIRTLVTNRSGYDFNTNEDGTLQTKDGQVFQLVPVKSNDCRAKDSKPSSYTHAGALREAQNQLSNAMNAPCSADQNKFVKRALELAQYVESGTRQR